MRCLLFLGSLAAAFAAVAVKDCSSGTSFFTIKSLSFSPEVPIAGQNGTLHSVYEVPMEIKAGTTKYSCSLNGLPVYSETFDLCSQTVCPITAGTHDDYSTSAIPGASGKVSCTIDWRDAAGSQLLCIQTIMTLAIEETRPTLRGSVRQPKLHFHTLLGTNLSENVTCPVVDAYDPGLAKEVLVDSETQYTEDSAPKTKDVVKALMILRSYNRYI